MQSCGEEMMNCTNCGSEESSLHGIRWSSEYGYIIKEGELLCDECAEKRVGFLEPGDLLKSKEEQYEKLASDE